jgi:hypothetical protein
MTSTAITSLASSRPIGWSPCTKNSSSGSEAPA